MGTTINKNYTEAEIAEIDAKIKAQIAYYKANPQEVKKIFEDKMKRLYSAEAQAESVARYEAFKAKKI